MYDQFQLNFLFLIDVTKHTFMKINNENNAKPYARQMQDEKNMAQGVTLFLLANLLFFILYIEDLYQDLVSRKELSMHHYMDGVP